MANVMCFTMFWGDAMFWGDTMLCCTIMCFDNSLGSLDNTDGH